jgi:hypothetical protein
MVAWRPSTSIISLSELLCSLPKLTRSPYTKAVVSIPDPQSTTENGADNLSGLTEWDDSDLESFLNSLV